MKLIRIKIDGFPQKIKRNWHPYISFFSGTLLATSETMPFFDNKYIGDGIIHGLLKIQQEYKSDFK